jgi:hypothetical protein
MRRQVFPLCMAALLVGCGSDSTGPSYGPPVLLLVNGVTKATGLVGMTVLLEGRELAEARYGDVYFLGSDGAPCRPRPQSGRTTTSSRPCRKAPQPSRRSGSRHAGV